MTAALPVLPAPSRGVAPQAPTAVGDLIRLWRQRRRLSQLDLALDAGVSTRHLSCVETGRAQPSREMVLRLAERLDVPLRERNELLTAAGFAPMYRERPLADPALQAAREAVGFVLRGLEPCPALAVDRHWQLVEHNAMLPIFLEGLPAELLVPPVNVLRLSLHPLGLAPRIVNLGAWRAHMLLRLQQQVDLTADPTLQALRRELQQLPLPAGAEAPPAHEPPRGDAGGVVMPVQLRFGNEVWSFFTTTTIFGTPVDITLSELAIEAFFPADAVTAAALRRVQASKAASPP